MFTVVKNLKQLQQAQVDAWIYGIIVVGIALALAILISMMINWRSNRRDFKVRRIWFILLGLALPLIYWLCCNLIWVPRIQNIGFQSQFKDTVLYVLIVSIVLYAVVGVLLMFCFRNSKFGSILGKKRN